jgi:uncharacterized membrane protein YfcA
MSSLSINGIKNKPLATTLLFGVLSGFVNGLLGAGGGILLVLALKKILKKENVDEKEVFANSLAVMLPVSVFSAFLYALRGNVSFTGFDAFVLPAILGGIFGALLLGRLTAKTVRALFGALVIVSGIIMIIR